MYLYFRGILEPDQASQGRLPGSVGVAGSEIHPPTVQLLNQTGPTRCRGLFRGVASPVILCHKEPDLVGGI